MTSQAYDWIASGGEMGKLIRSTDWSNTQIGPNELQLVLPEETVLLDADPVRLAQVVSNLLNNAARYSKPGGRILRPLRLEPASCCSRSVIQVPV